MTWREPKRRPYAMARRGVWEDGRVGKPALRVYLEMESAASKDRLCWLSVKTIADRLGMDERAVQKAREELKAFGKIEFIGYRTMPGRGLAVAIYRMLGDAAEPPPAANDLGTPAQEPAPAKLDTPGGEPPRPNDAAAPANLGSRPGEIMQPPRSNPPPNQEGLCENNGEDDDEGRAHAREASSSSAPDDYSDEGQALLIFDEMASRLGWPMAGRLTTKDRRAMAARLREAGALKGWRAAMEKAEVSNYLARTKPGLRFFLDEDNFAQLMRGQYDPDRDPPLKGKAATFAAMMGALGRLQRDHNASPAYAPPPPPPPAARPTPAPKRAPRHLRNLAAYCGKTSAEIEALTDRWIAELAQCGLTTEAALDLIARECRTAVPGQTSLEDIEQAVRNAATVRAA
jgi:hypothetical protein